jgi:hypothetical protein
MKIERSSTRCYCLDLSEGRLYGSLSMMMMMMMIIIITGYSSVGLFHFCAVAQAASCRCHRENTVSVFSCRSVCTECVLWWLFVKY